MTIIARKAPKPWISGQVRYSTEVSSAPVAHIRFGPVRSASRPSGTAKKNVMTPAIVRPRPTCAADSPTIRVKNTALPVRNAPSPTAYRIDCTESRRASGFAGSTRFSNLDTNRIQAAGVRIHPRLFAAGGDYFPGTTQDGAPTLMALPPAAMSANGPRVVIG